MTPETLNDGDLFTIDGYHVPIAWYVRMWHWLNRKPREYQLFRAGVPAALAEPDDHEFPSFEYRVNWKWEPYDQNSK